MSIHDEIQRRREHKGWSMQRLADEVSTAEGLKKPLTWQTVQQWENGKSAPRRSRLATVARLLGVSLHEMMVSADFESLEPSPGYSTLQPVKAWEHEDELPEGEFVMVPRLEVHLSAGNGTHGSQVEIQFNERQPQAFRSEWIREQHLKPNKLAAMTAKGNSMEPTIHHGDSLLIDTSQIEVIDGKVYALWYEGGERVKRLYRLPGGGLRIRSDNEGEHPEIVLGPEYLGHVRIIGRVVHRSGMGGL